MTTESWRSAKSEHMIGPRLCYILGSKHWHNKDFANCKIIEKCFIFTSKVLDDTKAKCNLRVKMDKNDKNLWECQRKCRHYIKARFLMYKHSSRICKQIITACSETFKVCLTYTVTRVSSVSHAVIPANFQHIAWYLITKSISHPHPH